MDSLAKLRKLIWDQGMKLFTDPELEEYLADSGGNVYRAAALVLDIIRGDPERITAYSRGGVSVTKADLDKTIYRYEQLSGDRAIKTVKMKRAY